MSGPTTTIAQDLERGDALRELSRAQRQLLAALAALDAADPRDRAAAARALDHAEGRLVHAMSVLERFAAGGRRLSGAAEADAPGRICAEPEPPAAAADVGGAPPADVGGYLAEVADLARSCAADVGELRSLLHTVSRLGQAPEEAVDTASDVGDVGAASSEDGSRRRRQVLQRVASDLGTAALDDLEQALAAIEARMRTAAGGAAAAAAPPATARTSELDGPRASQPAAGPAAALPWQADLRLGVLEERLAAVERRVRWLEAVSSGTDGP